jgi:hypothetical protein
MNVSENEQRDIDYHAGHRVMDITTYSDSRITMLCAECNVTFTAGSIETKLPATGPRSQTKMWLLLVALAVTGAASAQSTTEHAAATVANIHDTMLDPASFVLDGAYTTKPDKKGAVSYCYAFRAHNAMGGYAEARAVEWVADKGRLSFVNAANTGAFLGYDAGWVSPCKSKNIDRDITADVAALAQSLYKKAK